ncbi:MAG: hypothetical protein ACTSUY_12050, partial [Alphaproteobacteria bacterium]
LQGISALGARHRDLAQIMMTTRPTAGQVASARQFGIEEIITKPFSVADLDARIKRCVIARRLAQENSNPPGKSEPELVGQSEPEPAPAKADPELEIVYI